MKMFIKIHAITFFKKNIELDQLLITLWSTPGTTHTNTHVYIYFCSKLFELNLTIMLMLKWKVKI